MEVEDVAFHFREFGGSKSIRIGGNVFALSHPDQWNYSFVMDEVAHTSRTVRYIPSYHFEHGIPDNKLKYIQINNMHGLKYVSHGAPIFDLK